MGLGSRDWYRDPSLSDEQRKILANDLKSNRLFNELMLDLERRAYQAFKNATTELSRIEAQYQAKAVETLRKECERAASKSLDDKGGE